MTRILRAIACLVVASGSAHGFGQDFPTRPISIVIPFAAGGPTDVIARILAQSMAKLLGNTVIVENATGAGGTIAASKVMRAAPDGHTVLLHHNGMATSVALYR